MILGRITFTSEGARISRLRRARPKARRIGAIALLNALGIKSETSLDSWPKPSFDENELRLRNERPRRRI